jgi:tetratricopeptide (TPR) repeat protein
MPRKGKKKRQMTAEGVAVSLLRSLRGWNQTELAKASGIDKSLIWRYGRGIKSPRRRTLERLCAAVGVPFLWIERLLPGIRQALAAIENCTTAQALPKGATASTQFSADLLDLTQLGILVDGQLPRTTEQARHKALELWEHLKDRPSRDRRVLIEGAGEYRSWALCERLCFASKSAAANDAREAVDLAELAVRIAELVPEQEAFRLRLQGFAWAFLANARRVQGNHPKADEAFARSDELWSAGAPGAQPELLDEARLPDLKASLRRHQGWFAEALELHDRALSLARPEDRGSYLINKARTLEEMARYEESIETLKQAEPLIDAQHEPRDLFALRFNFALNLCHLEKYENAQARLPEITGLVTRLGTHLDKLRLRWLEGKVAAGLGRLDEALAAFSQVRAEFADLKIAFDTALVTLELAAVHLELGHTGEVKTLARQMVTIFDSQAGHREALAALRLFCRAAEQEKATLDLARRLIAYLNRARQDPKLVFEPGKAAVGSEAMIPSGSGLRTAGGAGRASESATGNDSRGRGSSGQGSGAGRHSGLPVGARRSRCRARPARERG